MPLPPGTRLGPYEILSPLGAGGMGEVYVARDTRLDRTVAIKLLQREFSDDSSGRARFEREAKTIASLSHPHICTLHDVGDHQGVAYLVMERLEGETLAARLMRGLRPLLEAIACAGQIAEGLECADAGGTARHADGLSGPLFVAEPADAGVYDRRRAGAAAHRPGAGACAQPVVHHRMRIQRPCCRRCRPRIPTRHARESNWIRRSSITTLRCARLTRATSRLSDRAGG